MNFGDRNKDAVNMMNSWVGKCPPCSWPSSSCVWQWGSCHPPARPLWSPDRTSWDLAPWGEPPVTSTTEDGSRTAHCDWWSCTGWDTWTLYTHHSPYCSANFSSCLHPLVGCSSFTALFSQDNYSMFCCLALPSHRTQNLVEVLIKLLACCLGFHTIINFLNTVNIYYNT